MPDNVNNQIQVLYVLEQVAHTHRLIGRELGIPLGGSFDPSVSLRRARDAVAELIAASQNALKEWVCDEPCEHCEHCVRLRAALAACGVAP